MSKLVGPTSAPVEVLGVEIDGERQTISVSVKKLFALCEDTERVLRLGTSTGFEMSQLVGRWTWAALVVRPALSVLNAVYRFVECSWHRRFVIWPTVRKELRLLVGLAPLLVARLSVPEFPYTVATDASSKPVGQIQA